MNIKMNIKDYKRKTAKKLILIKIKILIIIIIKHITELK